MVSLATLESRVAVVDVRLLVGGMACILLRGHRCWRAGGDESSFGVAPRPFGEHPELTRARERIVMVAPTWILLAGEDNRLTTLPP